MEGLPKPTVSSDQIREQLLAGEHTLSPSGKYAYGTVEISLEEGESAWNPSSTKRLLYGPARLVYEFLPGGIRIKEYDPA